jgi:uncharacterized protein YfaP (DUF2135 family)
VEEEMKHAFRIVLILMLVFVLASCDKDSSDNKPAETSQALANYWTSQTNLTESLETRDETMDSIQERIIGLGDNKSKNAIEEIDALVNGYIAQSNEAAGFFDEMRRLEDNIRPYGDDKNIFGDIARGVYNKASGAVISSGRMVRSGWRVLSGRQSLRQVLNDPESGIPIVSSFAADLQRHNAQRDAAIRQAILENNSQDGWVPISSLPGNTPEEKANAYLNLSDEDPLKMGTRRDVMFWDADERTRTANTARKLGETGVKIVADSYGGGAGEWTNEVLNQHMSQGQDPSDKGSMEIKVRSTDSGNPPVEQPKIVIIDKVNTPDSDPRVTVFANAPETLVAELPTGDYNIIASAEEFIRNVESAFTVAYQEVREQVNTLLKLAENAIIIEGITADSEVVSTGSTVGINLSCVSTLGQDLSFEWSITGGEYGSMNKNRNRLSFVPQSEGDFTINVEVTDSFNNTRNASITISAIDASISFVEYAITAEDINDNMLNPGELATVRLHISNTGSTDLVGTTDLIGMGGVLVGFNQNTAEIPIGETAQFLANIQLPATFSSANAELEFRYLVEDQAGNPVIMSLPISIPVDFYVEINPIQTPVEDRVLTVRGRVANPQLTRASMIVDGDVQQAYEMELYNGYFQQNIVVGSSYDEQEHTVEVTAISGSLEAIASQTFTSQIPPTALRVTLTWDTSGTDVDLWVTDPNGERCYYANSTTASGLTLDFDDTDGFGPENITTTNIIPGDYLVQVHYYSDDDYENAISTNATVVIRINEGSPDETVNNYYGFLYDTGDLWTVTTLTFDGNTWRLKERNQKTIQESAELPEK